LEHSEELERVIREIKRVLKPNKMAVFSIPVKNFVTNTYSRLIKSPASDGPRSHIEVINELERDILRLQNALNPLQNFPFHIILP